MKHTCNEIEPWLAREADGDLDEAGRAAVADHLATCAECRQAAAVQHGMRDLLVARADGLRTPAPAALAARIAAQVDRGTQRPAWAPFRVPMAATALLTLLTVGTYGLTGSSTTVLAAQLALDHLKCVKIVEGGDPAGLDPHRVADDWAQAYDWTLEVPDVPADVAARLIGARRCLYGHGHLAHLLYNVNGRVVSLFVMPRSEHPAGEAAELRQLFGQQARVWAQGHQTFALVSDVDAQGLDRLEQHFRAAD